VGWHDDLVSPLSGAAKSLAKLGYAVSTTSGLHRTWAELYDRLHDADVVLWWYWGPPIGELVALRRQLPDQVWAVFNWDDPHTVFTDANRMRDRAALWDLVFTSGESTIPYYQSRGAVREAVFLPPPADVDVFYPDLPADNKTGVDFDCDVNFVLTNLYAQFDPFPSTVNRTGLILALADAAEREGFRFHLYGPQGINIAPAHYKGGIDYEDQRQLFARCRLTINTHVNSGFGGRYANERDVIAPASGGLLLVDGVTPSILEHGRECLMMAATDPEQIAQQVVQILRDYDTYLHIRRQAVQTVRQKYSADAWAGTVDAGIRRFMHSR
jgi:glycosyltransferase involved in cell wall biosynthesis